MCQSVPDPNSPLSLLVVVGLRLKYIDTEDGWSLVLLLRRSICSTTLALRPDPGPWSTLVFFPIVSSLSLLKQHYTSY